MKTEREREKETLSPALSHARNRMMTTKQTTEQHVTART